LDEENVTASPLNRYRIIWLEFGNTLRQLR